MFKKFLSRPISTAISIAVYTIYVFTINYNLQSIISMVSISYIVIISKTYLGNIFKCFQNENSDRTDFTDILYIPTLTIILFVFFVPIQCLYGNLDFENIPFIITWFIVAFLIQLYDLDFNETTYFKKIEDLELDCGAGWAYGFFYGYLKLVLPASGRGDDGGIIERFEKYESREGVTIFRRKLFILIPRSGGYLPPRLDGELDNWIEGRKPLEVLEIDRAGVSNRPYKNSIYVVRDPAVQDDYRPFYICMEGATPLKTLDEACGGQTFGAGKLRQHKKRIAKHFYTVLKSLLDNDPACGPLCELVYYDDEANVNSTIGQMIYDRYLKD